MKIRYKDCVDLIKLENTMKLIKNRFKIMRIYYIALFAILLSVLNVNAQEIPDGWSVALGTVESGDTIPMYNIPMVDIFGAVNPAAAMSLREYQKLRYNVLKVYPYAKRAAKELDDIKEATAKYKKNRHKKKKIKEREKVLKEQLESELRKLTRSQGRVLIKLIDRETGETSYELIKDLRGSVRAFFWQKAARFIGSNLKSEYDPEGEDVVIESIVLSIERGELNYQNLYQSNYHNN